MQISALINIALACAGVAIGMEIPRRDYDSRQYFAVELDTAESSEPLRRFIAEHKGAFRFEHPARGIDDHYVFSIDKRHGLANAIGNVNSEDENLFKRSPGYEDVYDAIMSNRDLKSIQVLVPRRLERRMPVPITEEEYRRDSPGDSSLELLNEAKEKLGINDPTFKEQWHLVNTFNPGHDVNVTGLWYEGITGKGVVTALIDDGLDYESEDLKDNFSKEGSWDYNDNRNLPLPTLYDDWHGTRCAGEIAAVKNDVCGVGVAYESKVSGIRILSGPITAEDEAAAMIYGLDVNDIYSCSWGPTDNGKVVSAPNKIVKKAMIKGIQEGRDKKGAIYVFASGNGARFGDSCNFDGYTNSIYSITVGAVDYKGLHPLYSEACSAVMVVTYSSGSGEHIHTTDIKKKCSASHGGTSAAAPLAAGIFSLVLQMNPQLTWRDLQYIAALSAVPVNEDDGNYQESALGRKYSQRYGFGKLDAYAIAHYAKDWKNVKPQAWYYSDLDTVNQLIGTADSDKTVIKSVIKVSEQDLKVTNVERVEHVTVTVNIASNFRGKIGVRLVSPRGMKSELATERKYDRSGSGLKNWTFMSVANWGEKGHGDWTLEVFAFESEDNVEITFHDWSLRIFGESADANKAETYDIDKDYAAVRRDRLEEDLKATSSLASATESSPETTVETSLGTGPTATDDKQIETTASQTSETSSASETSGVGEGKVEYKKDHFGTYFIALALVGFVIVVLVMRYHRTPGGSRRRRRRDEYEFDIIPGEDYSDSEEETDSLDLGERNQRTRGSEEARDRLFDELHAETLPDYEEEMFRIVDDEQDEVELGNDKAGGNDKTRGVGKSDVDESAATAQKSTDSGKHSSGDATDQ